MGGVRNGAAEEDWLWDLNPGVAAIPKREPRSFGRVGTPWLQHSCWCLEPESRISTSFPEIRYPGLGRGEKEGLCASVGILKDFSISMKTLSHYSKSVCLYNF